MMGWVSLFFIVSPNKIVYSIGPYNKNKDRQTNVLLRYSDNISRARRCPFNYNFTTCSQRSRGNTVFVYRFTTVKIITT